MYHQIVRTMFVVVSAVSMVGGCLLVPVLAAPADQRELMERISALEARLDAQAEQPAGVVLPDWARRFHFSGVIEVEAGYERVDYDDPASDDEDSSDITLATAQLGIDVDVVDNVSGSIVFLWEEDDTEPVDVDEAFITLGGSEQVPVYLRGGKMYLPFGDYTTSMISDPLTQELGEIRESALEVGYEASGFCVAAYVFNGDIDEAGEDSHIDNFGVTVGYTLERDNFNIDVGVCYINNLIDSDGYGDAFEDAQDEAAVAGATLELKDYVGGFGAHVVVDIAGVNIVAEYVGATEDPEYLLNGVKTTGDAISAWNIELGYTFTAAAKEITVAAGYQGSDDAAAMLAESRYIGTVAVAVAQYTTLALEYRHDEFDNDDEGDAVTAQLALEF